MFRKKNKLSTKILNTDKAEVIAKMYEDLRKVEEDLKKEYDKWKTTQENEALEAITKNPKVFYKCASKNRK